MRQFLLMALAVCAVPIYVVGQSPQAPQVVPIARPSKIASHFNSERNLTTVVMGFSDVGGETPCGLYLSANGFYQGRVASAPSKITLLIMRITPEDKIKSAPLRDLTMVVDGEMMNLGVMETASQQTNMDLRLETLELSISYESFLKIANGKKVEAKLGSTRFALTDNNLNFMRQFVDKFKG